MEDDRTPRDTGRSFDIAIIGLSCRFPGANNAKDFWQNLCDGVESIARFSDKEILDSGVDASVLRDPRYVKAAPILQDPGMFDAKFFGFAPAEAQALDPQHRVLLECAHEALEDAGYDPDRYRGRIGVYAGCAMNTYLMNNGQYSRFAEEYIPTLIGNDKDFLSTRISYKLNLRGPSITVQTACSTSLVAIHLACQSLLSEESDMALAGAVAVKVPHRVGYLHDGGGVLSPDGHVRAFDAKANGTVFGSGAGVVVLKRFSEAVSDGDDIYAVIKGSAINNDGSEKAGYTAPSVNRQSEAVLEALSASGVEADTIGYMEAHGSGTPLGDPIEIAALTKAFRHFTQRREFCAVGSVKTNVGHLDVAAGIAGVIKTVLAIKNGRIPPSLHYSQPNPDIDFANSPFHVASRLSGWPGGGPRRAGVMSTGMGGTNAHLILEEAPEAYQTAQSPNPQLLVLSAKSETALDQIAGRLSQHLKTNQSIEMADVAYTLQMGRRAFAHRRFVVSANREQAIEKLESLSPKDAFSIGQGDPPASVVTFLFPGVGDHYVGMGHDLYQGFAVFRHAVDRCAEILRQHIEVDIRAILYPAGHRDGKQAAKTGIDLKKMLAGNREEPADEATQRLNQTIYAQPALFTIEYALALQWLDWGVVPAAMVGHSMGEYVAACLAGVFSVEDALQLICRRASLVDRLPSGAMLAVALPEKELVPLLHEGLSVSLVNGPELCVVAGLPAAVSALEKTLGERAIISRPVRNQHAFHSRLLDPIVPEYETEVRKVTLKPPRIPYISNVTGTWIKASDATDPAYWARHANHTARFADALSTMWQQDEGILVEIGPGKTLGVLATQHPARNRNKKPFVVSSLRHGYDNQSDATFLMHSVGKVWQWGADIRWDRLCQGEKRRRVVLPAYPFEREHFWIEAPSNAANNAQGPDGAAITADIDQWFYAPSWKRSTFPQAVESEASWMIIMDKGALGNRIRDHLERHGQRVRTVVLSDHYAHTDGSSFTIDASKPDDYGKMFKQLGGFVDPSLNIVHLGCVSDSAEAAAEQQDREIQQRGFFSLLFIAQSIGDIGIASPVRIGVISNGVHRVTGGEMLCPQKATLLGPCGVIPKEYDNITCFNLDLEFPVAREESPQDLARKLTSEFSVVSGSPVLAYRGTYRWARAFEKIGLGRSHSSGSKQERRPARLRKGGTYLITGGTGGIGLTIAQYLADEYHAKLALTKKSKFPDKGTWSRWLLEHGDDDLTSHKIRQIMAMEASGAEVLVLIADVSDKEEMRVVIEETQARFGPISGVVHAAGTINPGIVQAKTVETVERVFSPKVAGTLVLNELLKDVPIDFLVLFSSVTSVLTPNASVDYSASNAFLDVFADYSGQVNRFYTLSINWPGWKQVGLLAELKALPGVEEWKREALNKAISPKEGLEVFERALCADLPRIIVSPEDLICLYEQSTSASDMSAKYAKVLSAGQSRIAGSGLRKDQDSPNTEVEKLVAGVWREVLGLDAIGIHESFSDVGGHSLLAMQVVTRLRNAFQVTLTLKLMLENPTIAGLSAKIEEAVVAGIEGLTDEEAQRMLASGIDLRDSKV